MEYSKRDDWQINKHVLEVLVRCWVETRKLRINTTKGNVDIKGELEFTGQGKANIDSPVVVINILKRIDSGIKAIPKVKSVIYSVAGWKKHGNRWMYAPTREMMREDEIGQGFGGGNK